MTFDLVRRLMPATTAVVFAAGAALLTPAVSSADACPDVEVVFARGTGEPPGLGRVGDAFVASLRSEIAPPAMPSTTVPPE